MNSEEIDRFIESWGSMGIFWGINRSMARVHALILVSENPVDLDLIANRLNISRGNASMCLKDLRNWGVIQRVHQSGDRRDFYVAEPDVWKMFFRIAVGRKTREFDPALHALHNVLTESDIENQKKVYIRLTQLEDILSTMNSIMEKCLENEKKSKTMFDFFKDFLLK